jgi:hypothetical protein
MTGCTVCVRATALPCRVISAVPADVRPLICAASCGGSLCARKKYKITDDMISIQLYRYCLPCCWVQEESVPMGSVLKVTPVSSCWTCDCVTGSGTIEVSTMDAFTQRSASDSPGHSPREDAAGKRSNRSCCVPRYTKKHHENVILLTGAATFTAIGWHLQLRAAAAAAACPAGPRAAPRDRWWADWLTRRLLCLTDIWHPAVARLLQASRTPSR